MLGYEYEDQEFAFPHLRTTKCLLLFCIIIKKNNNILFVFSERKKNTVNLFKANKYLYLTKLKLYRIFLNAFKAFFFETTRKTYKQTFHENVFLYK